MKALLFASCVPMLWVISAVELFFTVLLFSHYIKTKNLIFMWIISTKFSAFWGYK